ncbi:MAG: ATP-grasp domain-containing protein [Planctomycetota bacterium]|nr:ATP-grasp domain-containing protein [Planctomycetota bacterium]
MASRSRARRAKSSRCWSSMTSWPVRRTGSNSSGAKRLASDGGHELLAERGADLEGGLVLREFVALERVGAHPRSGMPLSVEARAFLLEGAPVHVLPYWEGTAARVPPPPISRFLPALRGLGSPFLAVDLARRADGEWLLLEVGDGQVSGLPEDADPAPLFLALARCLRRLGSPGSEEPRRDRGDGPAARSDSSAR